VTDSGEECDGGDACTPTCTRKSVVALQFFLTPTGAAAGVAFLGVLGAMGYFQRKKLSLLLSLLRRRPPASLEEVPLSEFEYPGRKN